MPSMVRGAWYLVRGGVIALACVSASVRLCAQTEATVNRLAPILAAEDARDYQEGLLGGALLEPDTLVRRTAIRALGRIGDPRAVPLLLRVLDQPDAFDLHAEAAFALGLLRDSSAVPGLIARLRDQRPLSPTAIDESVLALARIGGPVAATFIAEILRDGSVVRADGSRGGAAKLAAAREAWRLGPLAPVPALAALVNETGFTGPVIYGLGRLRAKEAAPLFVTAASAGEPGVRQDGVRALSKGYAQGAGLDATLVIQTLKHALADLDAGVRVNALRALGTWADSTLAIDVVPLLDDASLNVQVTAAATLGALGGTGGVSALKRIHDSRRPWAVRREALLALAKLDVTTFRSLLPVWISSNDWRDRATAADALARVAPQEPAVLLTDPDARVVNAALQAWAGANKDPDPALLEAARARLTERDAMVRATSAEIIGLAQSGGDVPALRQAYLAAARDSFPDAAQSALGALLKIAGGPDSNAVRGFLASPPPASDPQLKGWAEANWPALAERWGPSRPLATGRSIEDYRLIARQYLVAVDSTRYPRVTIEVADRGPIVVELFGPDAPLTVANFLRLVDRHYFDGQRWHRVVPNFVIQAGDPRGDGNGGPGWAIRDEINRRRYNAFVMGMALSGPDTGGSQWFITLGPQPHLDGNYTVFGRLKGGDANAQKVVQGDLIRSIHR